MRILLVQLGANGDCLFVTTIARQIKEIDYPGSHLTWMIGSRYIQVLENNPYIDNIIDIPLPKGKDEIDKLRRSIPELVKKQNEYQNFDKVFITDFTPANYNNWFGTTRSSLFRSYPHQLKVNPKPLIFLSESEKLKVKDFCSEHSITQDTFNILFECDPQSGQSQLTFDIALIIAHKVILRNDRIKFIMSSSKKFISNSPNIIDGSGISWRENAELINYCNLLVGCSSGISWLCTSNASSIKPTIQIVDPGYMGGKFSASMKVDFKYFGIDTNTIIELHNPAEKVIIDCMMLSANENFLIAKKKYDVSDLNCYKDFRFLKTSPIPLFQKIIYAIRFHFLSVRFYFMLYRKLLQSWSKNGT